MCVWRTWNNAIFQVGSEYINKRSDVIHWWNMKLKINPPAPFLFIPTSSLNSMIQPSNPSEALSSWKFASLPLNELWIVLGTNSTNGCNGVQTFQSSLGQTKPIWQRLSKIHHLCDFQNLLLRRVFSSPLFQLPYFANHVISENCESRR